MEHFPRDPLKSALLALLSDLIRNLGSSRQVVADRLGVLGPDITAIHNGDVDRFTIDRLRRLLRRLGHEMRVEVVPENRPLVGGAGLAALGLADLTSITESTTPGLVLIGGAANHGQHAVLRAFVYEHEKRGARSVFYRSGSSATANGNNSRISTYSSDLDIDQRARFGCDVIAVDGTGPVQMSPWTLLYFATEMRTYAVIESPFGISEGQAAVDQLVAEMGPALHVNDSNVLKSIREVVIVHSELTASDKSTRYFVSRFHVDPTTDKLVANDDAQTTETLHNARNSSARSIAFGPLNTPEQAVSFLGDVQNELGTIFLVQNPRIVTRREVEMHVAHRTSSASVTIAASWNNSANRFGIVLCLEEPGGVQKEIGRTLVPETRLYMAPTDVQHITEMTKRFLDRFSVVPVP